MVPPVGRHHVPPGRRHRLDSESEPIPIPTMIPPTLLPAVGRLAPSPTGGLHLGHARTFLIAWLAARGAGGRVVLRIEDLDATRVRPEATAGAIADLRWLGLDWDEGPDVGGPSRPYVQSERNAAYEAALERLKRSESVYPCTCTRADIERAASAPHAEDEGPTYPGTCAGRTAADARLLGDRPFAWRFRVPAGPVAWDDLFRGRVALDPSRIGGDFVVGRSPAAVVPARRRPRRRDDGRHAGDPGGRPRAQHAPADPALPGARLGRPRPSATSRWRSAPTAAGWPSATARSSWPPCDAGVDPRRLVGWLAQSCGWTDVAVPSSPRDWVGRSDLAGPAEDALDRDARSAGDPVPLSVGDEPRPFTNSDLANSAALGDDGTFARCPVFRSFGLIRCEPWTSSARSAMARPERRRDRLDGRGDRPRRGRRLPVVGAADGDRLAGDGRRRDRRADRRDDAVGDGRRPLGDPRA